MLKAFTHPLLTTRYLLSERHPTCDVIPFLDKSIPSVIVKGPRISIEIHGMVGFKTEKQRQFYIASMELKAKVWSSVDFKKKFLALSVTETNGQSLDNIYNKLIFGNDRFGNTNDGDIDVKIHIYKTLNRSTVGYHNSCCLDTYTNSYHFDKWVELKYGRAYMAGHSGHEYFHVMGYSHKFVHSKSLVYKAGYLTRDLGVAFIDGKTELLPVT